MACAEFPCTQARTLDTPREAAQHRRPLPRVAASRQLIAIPSRGVSDVKARPDPPPRRRLHRRGRRQRAPTRRRSIAPEGCVTLLTPRERRPHRHRRRCRGAHRLRVRRRLRHDCTLHRHRAALRQRLRRHVLGHLVRRRPPERHLSGVGLECRVRERRPVRARIHQRGGLQLLGPGGSRGRHLRLQSGRSPVLSLRSRHLQPADANGARGRRSGRLRDVRPRRLAPPDPGAVFHRPLRDRAPDDLASTAPPSPTSRLSRPRVRTPSATSSGRPRHADGASLPASAVPSGAGISTGGRKPVAM